MKVTTDAVTEADKAIVANFRRLSTGLWYDNSTSTFKPLAAITGTNANVDMADISAPYENIYEVELLTPSNIWLDGAYLVQIWDISGGEESLVADQVFYIENGKEVLDSDVKKLSEVSAGINAGDTDLNKVTGRAVINRYDSAEELDQFDIEETTSQSTRRKV